MYDAGCRRFTYRNEDRVVSFCSAGEALLVSLPDKLVEWSKAERRILREFETENEILDIKHCCGRWILISKTMVELFADGEIRMITTKASMASSVVYGSSLILIDDEELIVVGILEGDAGVRRISLTSHNGMCSSILIHDGGLLVSFENGKVFKVEEELMVRIISLGVEKLHVDDMDCLLFLKEPIISMGILEAVLVISLFSGKVLTLNICSRDVAFTELLHEIRGSCTWKKFIVVNDIKNNVIFLDEELKIIGRNSFDEEVCGVLVDNHTLMIGFRNGFIKEYGEDVVGCLELT